MAIESGAKRRPPLLLLLAGGALLGALSWLAALGVSGAFEPYDSALGLLANQLVLSLPIALLAFRYRLWTALLCLLGAYVGMNLYTYVFGGAETRAWAVLGAITSVALLVVPAAAAAASAFLSRMCRPPPKDDSAQGRDGS